MNSRRFFTLGICLALAQPVVFADDLQPLRELGKKALQALSQHQEEDGRRYFNEFLQDLRTTPGAATNVPIELTLGALGCALPESREMGRKALERAKRAKDKKEVDLAVRLQASCDGSNVADLPENTGLDTLLASVNNEAPEVSGSLKGGDPWLHPVANVAIAHISPSDIAKRLEDTQNPATALAPTLTRFGGGTAGTVTKDFIVATDFGGQPRAVGIARCLERYRADLGREFDMVLPDHLITVYTTAWQDKVRMDAGRLHGLPLPSGTMAYSVYADLSMVGVASPEKCGSLGHELTHLMIRGNFGDAPAWLEEGLASAVALSIPENNHLSFRPGWRDRVLRSSQDMHLTVPQLLDFTWADFSPTDTAGLPRAAAIQALASVFVRYLAAKNKLHEVYFAVRKQNLLADIDHYRTPQQIVEEQLGKSLADVDKDFTDWFKRQSGGTRTSAATPCTPAAKNRPPVAQAAAPCEPATKPLH